MTREEKVAEIRRDLDDFDQGGPRTGPWSAARWIGHCVWLLSELERGPSAKPPPCGGTRCWMSPSTGLWVHSGRSGESCNVHRKELPQTDAGRPATSFADHGGLPDPSDAF
jgi:hypothetical protein